jgi:VanZ family protein
MIDDKSLPAVGIKSATSGNRLWRYGPLIVWAALIFIGSSDLLSSSHTSSFIVKPLRLLFPGVSDETLSFIHFFLRKLGHFTEYAILAFLGARAFRGSSTGWLRERWLRASLIFVVVYALSDEFHQMFVPTRTASIYDSMIDTAGGLTMLIFLAVRGQKPAR